MSRKCEKVKVAVTIILVCLLATVFSLTCSKDEKPEIVGCNSVKYEGYTYTNIGCAPGIRSFDTTITQGGHTASFHIECSEGCVSSVTVTGGKTVVGP